MAKKAKPIFAAARAEFHLSLLKAALRTHEGIPSNADSKNGVSIAIANGLVQRIGQEVQGARLPGQTSGKQFEEACSAFLHTTFLELGHLRPGRWSLQRGVRAISTFQQYAHLAALQKIAEHNMEVAIALGSDYLIKPDIVLAREPESDESINSKNLLIGDDDTARLSVLRAANNPRPILHASVSCKWTIRSDRAQNARSEGLNLVKNRKGHLPHVVVITAEPLPSRIASIALGTGEIDCVYHFALHELQATLQELRFEDAKESINNLVEGSRLRDISDLPLDLAV